MKSAVAQPAEYTPLFNWAPPRSRRRSLLSFIAASAVLHALCFYLFQIIYPPTVALLPPPARVNLITPQSEDGRVLLRWIEAEDPALSSTTLRPPDAAALQPPQAQHVPSYANRQPTLRQLPPYEPDLSVPSARPPAPVPAPRSSPAPANARTATKITFGEDAAALGQPVLPPMQFSVVAGSSPDAARFRVAISSRGDVRHCFVADSSGDASLDEQARRYLMLCRFPAIEAQPSPSESDPLWTEATVVWGTDLAPPAPAPSSSPAL